MEVRNNPVMIDILVKKNKKKKKNSAKNQFKCSLFGDMCENRLHFDQFEKFWHDIRLVHIIHSIERTIVDAKLN